MYKLSYCALVATSPQFHDLYAKVRITFDTQTPASDGQSGSAAEAEADVEPESFYLANEHLDKQEHTDIEDGKTEIESETQRMGTADGEMQPRDSGLGGEESDGEYVVVAVNDDMA